MRKMTQILFTIGISIGLVACNNEPIEEIRTDMLENETATESESEEESENNDTEEALDNDEQHLDETDKTTDEDAVSNIDISDFEEAAVIESEIDISDLDVRIETDNRNNRVILFQDHNDPIYKTVYLKHDRRLKIISIYEDRGQIFNEII